MDLELDKSANQEDWIQCTLNDDTCLEAEMIGNLTSILGYGSGITLSRSFGSFLRYFVGLFQTNLNFKFSLSCLGAVTPKR